jgi:PAS domain S-box-containing protein
MSAKELIASKSLIKRSGNVALRSSELNRLVRLYETILSTTDDFAYVFDTQGRFLYANKRLLEVWARNLDQVIGKTCYDLGYPTWHADMHMREIEQVVKTKEQIRGEVPFTGDSGISGIYDYIFKPVLDAEGNVEAIIGTTRDVTDQKRDAQRYQFLADTMPQIVWTAKPDGQLDYYNKRWFEYSDTDFKKMEELGWTHFVHPDDLPKAGERRQKSIETGSNYEVDFRIRRASDQTYRWHLVRAFPMRNEQHEVIQWFGTCTDIHDQLQSAEELKKVAAKFEALFDQSAVLAGILSLDGTVVECNKLSLEGCGYHASDVIGKLFWEGPWWKDSKSVQDEIQKAVKAAAGGTPFLKTLPYRKSDGLKRMTDFAIHPIRDTDGKIVFLHPIGMDVTERLEAQSRADFLGRLTQKLAPLIDAQEINRVATSEIGQFMGADRCYFVHALPEKDQVRVLGDWAIESQVSIAGDYSLTQFGNREWIQAYTRSPFSVQDSQTHPWTLDFTESYKAINIRAYAIAPYILEGSWVACVAVCSSTPRQWTAEEMSLLENAVARVWPLIERAWAEGALREAQKALHGANDLLNDKARHLETVVQQRTTKLRETIHELEAFSYSISHDMRAPLRAMTAFSAILNEDHSATLDDAGKDLLKRINAASRRMDQLIQDVLSYSQVSTQEIVLTEIDLNSLIRELVHSYPNLDPSIVDIDIPSPLPLVKGNDALLTQCVSNLLDNAVKFTKPHQKPKVTVTAESHDTTIRVCFQDNGIGISEQNIGRVFDIFQRVGRDTPGTGIGLAVVRKAAEKMGGSTGVSSELGRGSLFWLDLPLPSLS